jgi:hypothetical protein
MTIRDHILTLPDGYRELALRYEDRQLMDWSNNGICMYYSISVFTEWSETDELWPFWNAVDNHYRIGTPLPPLPNNKP